LPWLVHVVSGVLGSVTVVSVVLPPWVLTWYVIAMGCGTWLHSFMARQFAGTHCGSLTGMSVNAGSPM